VTRTLHQQVVFEPPPTSDDGPLLVEADANQLQQALVNLALNARDAVAQRQARPEGAAAPTAVHFRLRRLTTAHERPAFPQNVPPGDFVVLEVEDRGAGMTPEVLNQALDPFFTTKGVGQGTGLGLPMVFGIVQGHHGALTIDSAPGVGTCVGIYLPRLARAPAEADEPAGAAESGEPEAAPGRTILVVDDEESVRDVVRRFLEIAGHRVHEAESGRDALEWLNKGRAADLVVLDLMIPREDAAATLQGLRRKRPGLPVLLCTGLPQAEPAPALLSRPSVSLIRKPFRMNELWSAVRLALASDSR
jgi:two-component system cell cycle sensor histidine kinase/response regulator CckA